MQRKSKREWAEIRAAFWRGEGTLREVAKKYDVPYNTVRHRAAAEHWTNQQRRIGAEAAQLAVEKLTGTIAAMLARHRAVGELGLARALATLQAIELFDPDGLVATLKAAEIAVRIERLSAGLPMNEPAEEEQRAAGVNIRIIRGAPRVTAE